MSRVIVVESSQVQIAGTVASTLYELAQNQSGEYSSKREALKAALIQLSHNLHKLNQRVRENMVPRVHSRPQYPGVRGSCLPIAGELRA